MVRTRKLLAVLDDLARYRIFSSIGWLYIAITIIAGAIMVWLMIENTYIIVTSSLPFRCVIGAAPVNQCNAENLTTGSQPALTSFLLIPGLNRYIPVLYGIIGIVVAIIVHEGTHGVIARRLNLPVKSTGLLFFLFVPIGAFVEIDEKLIQKLRARDSARIMAGGPGSNVIVGLVALVLLIVLLGGLVPLHSGALVTQYSTSSPASILHSEGHLSPGDMITAVNDTQITSGQDLSSYMSNTKPNETLMLTVAHGSNVSTFPITLGTNPDNTSTGFIGVGVSDTSLATIRNTYASAFLNDPILYLIVPGIVPQAEAVVPFSGTLHSDYASPSLGALWYPLALTLFWIFFININLAFFNAIPLYPLDGGQAMLNWLSHFGRKSVEDKARMLTTICSLAMLFLILAFLFLPRILAAFPY